MFKLSKKEIFTFRRNGRKVLKLVRGSKLYTHEFTQTTARIGTIHLKKNSVVGEWSVVRPGIVVGENSLIAAMSFVNEDVPDNLVEGGVPIHIIKHIKRIMSRNKKKAKK